MKWVVLAVVVALVLDRLMLAAERRGWVYYRKRKPTSGAASAAAFGPMAELFQPGRQVVIEERQRQQNTRRDGQDGAPPQP